MSELILTVMNKPSLKEREGLLNKVYCSMKENTVSSFNKPRNKRVLKFKQKANCLQFSF